MPQISGLTEQQRALAEIMAVLKEIEKINFFIEIPNPTNLWELRFSVPVEESSDLNEPDEDALAAETHKEEAQARESQKTRRNSKNSKDKEKKARIKTHNTYSVPLYCEDKDGLYQYILNFKAQKREHVLNLAKEFNIVLDQNDRAILGIE